LVQRCPELLLAGTSLTAIGGRRGEKKKRERREESTSVLWKGGRRERRGSGAGVGLRHASSTGKEI
jgi:hypothetical protein